MKNRYFALVVLLLFGCGPTGAGSKLKVGNDGAEIEVSHAGIRTYMTGGAYRSWMAEPAVHESSQNSPHGKVRVYFNNTSYEGLKANTLPLAVGSMIVKDLFQADGVTLSGYAVMMKTSASSWTWWEAFTNNLDSPIVFGVDTATCRGCHSQTGNQDQVRTPVP